MSVEDSWYTLDRSTGKKVRTQRHGRGKRWRVRNRGARTVSFDKRTDADRWDAKVRTELAQGLTPFDHRAGVMTFGEYATKWMREHHHTGRGRETVQSWLDNHVLPTFAEKRMCDIRLSTIKEWWAGMRAKRYRGVPYSASLLESVYVTTGSILRSAVTDKVIPVHPMDGWSPELPTRDKAVRDIWEHERVDTVITALPERYRGVGTVSATCGHRQGESFAVALEDVNRFRKEITIRHQVLRIDGKTMLAPPKNNAVRVVPMASATLNAIDTHVERYGTTRVRCSCCGTEWHVVFTAENGELIKPRDFNRTAWSPALLSAGLAPGRANGQHNLRHYFVSLLIDGGATPKDIQTFVGHKSIKTTYDTYGHLFERANDRARNIVDQAFPAARTRCVPQRSTNRDDAGQRLSIMLEPQWWPSGHWASPTDRLAACR